MCGIAGNSFHNTEAPPPDRDTPAAMHDSLALRGPDGEGIWVLEECGIALAHRRLAIIDLSAAGTQPMASGDGALPIVYNGEIYDYRALRNDLNAEGLPFRSDSDTEVLLALYVKTGRIWCSICAACLPSPSGTNGVVAFIF